MEAVATVRCNLCNPCAHGSLKRGTPQRHVPRVARPLVGKHDIRASSRRIGVGTVERLWRLSSATSTGTAQPASDYRNSQIPWSVCGEGEGGDRSELTCIFVSARHATLLPSKTMKYAFTASIGQEDRMKLWLQYVIPGFIGEVKR